ncbi:helicase-associated domain-containing protein [Solwaraspora sp. WMMD1047]|uniref:helicase-associated domain-containing protein n=1 Tax=Solwaraspora sp. WMMD1047 TaxID=3016102 RepID=UPI0024177458|nr:helicase-associated domain-containing protein [Solwaraspora sp. WMMD1047]MDG4832091.1 helicase-associated domain-containing protein [Solwaraspora sp. WMMD1047]
MIDATWLRALGEAELDALLRRRPDATAAPLPASLAELADRLNQPRSLIAALRQLDRPTLQVAEALAALGGEADRTTLDRLLGVTPADPAGAEPAGSAAPAGSVAAAGRERAAVVDRALATLHGYALLTDRDRPRLTEAMAGAWEAPLGLGVPVAEAVRYHSADGLRRCLRLLDLKPATRKADLLAQLIAAYRDPELIRRVVATAPPATRELLMKSALTGEPVAQESHLRFIHLGYRSGPDRRADPAIWAYERGLLVPGGDWDDHLRLPAEIALALRGPGWTAPLDPEPPRPSTAPVAADVVARDAAAAGAAALRVVSALADEAGRSPFPTLKAGGLGVREIRRLAKRIGGAEAEIRLGLAVADHAGLLTFGPDGMTPTQGYDEWLRGEPADRLGVLLTAWWAMPAVPTGDAGAGWTPEAGSPGLAALRPALLRAAADLSTGDQPLAVADPAGLADLVAWRHPFLFGEPEAARLVTACWAEAALLGAVGAGALSAAGRALVVGDDPARALTDLGGTERTVRIQADLTAVVAGTPSAELTDVLDSAADRESRGTASTWRFTPGSVRRALDAGTRPDGLLAELAAVATGGVLPQPLTYLVNDVARRHGAVRGQDVACCLRADDPALLAEIAADRRLRGLALRVLAPTVLAGGRPLAETISALRAAGYAPLAESPDGTPILERAAPRRAPGPATAGTATGRARSAKPRPGTAEPRAAGPGKPGAAGAGAGGAGATGAGARPAGRSKSAGGSGRPEPAELARTLLGRPDQAAGPRSRSLPVVQAEAPQLTIGPARILAHAIDSGGPVRIDYVNQAGNVSNRVIESIELAGTSIFAWCRMRQDERMFNLSRILAVGPAD